MQVLNDVRREAKLKEFKNHVDALQEIADELNLGDPWSYNRMREILMSIMLNHTVAKVVMKLNIRVQHKMNLTRLTMGYQIILLGKSN